MSAPSGKYILIGPTPPPLGGISVYVDRFSRKLKSEGVDVRVVDPGKLSLAGRLWLALKIILSPRRNIYHLNSFNFTLIAALAFRPFGGTILFHDHAGRHVESISGIRRKIFQRFLRRVDEAIFVNDHISETYRRSGFEPPRSIRIEPAFLPPPLEDEPVIWHSYPPEIRQFVDSHKPLIIANAFRIAFYRETDLYGIDMCVDLVARLRPEFPNMGLLFALAEIGDDGYFRTMLQRIAERGIEPAFCFMTGQKELWPLFKKASLMVRPTYVDGFGISVAEALYLGCPAVASDVCKRAKGTVTFKNRDLEDFVTTSRDVLLSHRS